MDVVNTSWHDVDPTASLGVGLSRSGTATDPLWSMVVELPHGQPPFRGSIKAATKAEARKFLRNRYPRALVITVGGKVKAEGVQCS